MMAWTVFPLATDSVATRKAIPNDIVAAINEKRAMLGWPLIGVIVADDVAFYCNHPNDPMLWGPDRNPREAYCNWRYLCWAVEEMVPYFVDSASFGHDVSNIEGTTVDIPNYTLTTWRAAANIHADGFTAKTTRGGAELHRLPQPDDIVLRKMHNELYRGLCLLRWTKHGTSVVDNDPVQAGSANKIYVRPGPSDPFNPVTWANFVAGLGWNTNYLVYFGQKLPKATFWGLRVDYDGNPSWSAEVDRVRSKSKATIPVAGIGRACHFLYKVEDPTYSGVTIFDGNGDFTGEGWREAELVNDSTNAEVQMNNYVGSLTRPNACPQPDPQASQGYITTACVVVVVWDAVYI